MRCSKIRLFEFRNITLRGFAFVWCNYCYTRWLRLTFHNEFQLNIFSCSLFYTCKLWSYLRWVMQLLCSYCYSSTANFSNKRIVKRKQIFLSFYMTSLGWCLTCYLELVGRHLLNTCSAYCAFCAEARILRNLPFFAWIFDTVDS